MVIAARLATSRVGQKGEEEKYGEHPPLQEAGGSLLHLLPVLFTVRERAHRVDVFHFCRLRYVFSFLLIFTFGFSVYDCVFFGLLGDPPFFMRDVCFSFAFFFCFFCDFFLFNYPSLRWSLIAY